MTVSLWEIRWPWAEGRKGLTVDGVTVDRAEGDDRCSLAGSG